MRDGEDRLLDFVFVTPRRRDLIFSSARVRRAVKWLPTMLLSALRARERGFTRPQVLADELHRRRTETLALSSDRELVATHNGGVPALDVDPVEGRFLLAGGVVRPCFTSCLDVLMRPDRPLPR